MAAGSATSVVTAHAKADARGLAIVTFVSAATAASVGAAAGSSTAIAESEVLAATSFAITAAAGVYAKGTSEVRSAGTAAGIATASSTGVATAIAVGAAAGTAAATAVGVALYHAVGSSTGASTATGIAPITAVGAAAGTSDAIGVATAIPTDKKLHLKILADGLLPLFRDGITDTALSAEIWAKAYFAYTKTGNIVTIPVRRDILAKDLAKAFDPSLNGGGKVMFLKALNKYWVGTPTTKPLGSVTLFVPSGSIETSGSDPDATPEAQAYALADIIHELTVKSAKAWAFPAGPFFPVT
ncbi:MAG: hypothetical protein DRP42_00740 [Tenericutes bacterium]|nr:MAG: hypothetical protein DRP42_00740 [Mycoplasmatota bacterium]